jgi:hypothetical protein
VTHSEIGCDGPCEGASHGTRGAAATILTKRLRLRRNIASKAAGRRAGLYRAVLGRCRPQNTLRRGPAAQKREPRRAAGPPARRLPSSPLRVPRPPTARALAPQAPSQPRLTRGPPVPGAAAPSLSLIWPQHHRSPRRSEPRARGSDGGGALGSSCGEGGAPISPPAPSSAPRCLHSSRRYAPARLPTGLRGRPTRDTGGPLRLPAPHLASTRHYCPVSVRNHCLPHPGPNSSASPLHLQPLLGPALSSRTQAAEPRRGPPASPEPARQPDSPLPGWEEQRSERAVGAGGALRRP